MAGGAKLVCTEPFGVGFDGKLHSFNVGDEIDIAEAAKWPNKTLIRRLQNGFVEYRAEADELDEDEAEMAVETANAQERKRGRQKIAM